MLAIAPPARSGLRKKKRKYLCSQGPFQQRAQCSLQNECAPSADFRIGKRKDEKNSEAWQPDLWGKKKKKKVQPCSQLGSYSDLHRLRVRRGLAAGPGGQTFTCIFAGVVL